MKKSRLAPWWELNWLVWNISGPDGSNIMGKISGLITYTENATNKPLKYNPFMLQKTIFSFIAILLQSQNVTAKPLICICTVIRRIFLGRKVRNGLESSNRRRNIWNRRSGKWIKTIFNMLSSAYDQSITYMLRRINDHPPVTRTMKNLIPVKEFEQYVVSGR
jgi:hypothetical protein